jgi:hypothetical protein
VGLALAFVEIEFDSQRWQRRELVDGVCAIDPSVLPCRVRAPGHVTVTALKIEDEVVLEADALFVLEGDDLRRCVLEIGPFARFTRSINPSAQELRDKIANRMAFGFVDDEHWAIAVSGAGLGEEFGYRQTLSIELKDRSHRLIQIEFQATPGARGRWTLTCPTALAVADLDVEVVRPEGEPRGRVDIALAMYRDRGVLETIVESWGKVILQPGLRVDPSATLAADSDRLHMPAIPTGEQAVLTFLDTVSHASGRLVFVHDGTARRVVLHSGFTLAGRISVPAAARLPTRMRMVFGALNEDANDSRFLSYFVSDLRDVSIASDGSFQVRGPERVPTFVDYSADAPALLGLEIEALGFDAHRSTWPLGAATRVDCGTIALQPSYAPIVLAPGHGLSASAVEWQSLVTGPGDDQWWNLRFGRLEADGALALVFADEYSARTSTDGHAAEDRAAKVAHIREGLPDPRQTPALMIYGSDDDEFLGFTRGPDGRYERAAERDYTIDIDAHPATGSDSKLDLSLQWRGIPKRFRILGPDRATQRTTLHLRAPREGVTLTWSPPSALGTPNPREYAVAGSIALDAERLTVPVP